MSPGSETTTPASFAPASETQLGKATQSGATAPIALVTAGARRLAKAMVMRLAQLGYDVALHYNSSQTDAEQTASEVKVLGRRCFIFQRDFADPCDVQSLITEVKQNMGAPSLLIN